MSFFEDSEKQELRHATSTPFHIQHAHQLDTPISVLKEVSTFKYLGVYLDKHLTFDTAMKQSMKNFWYAHSQARQLDMHVHGLHPKHQLTLWKQLIWSTMDSCLPFLHSESQASYIDQQINLSLSSIFVPKLWETDCLHKALRTELRIPSALNYIHLAKLQLHTLFAQQPEGMPAKTLYQITQQLAEHRPTPADTSTAYIAKYTQNILTAINKTTDWKNNTYTLTPKHPRRPYPPTMTEKTKVRHWLNSIAMHYVTAEHEQLLSRLD
jgi:hypothetical protein